MRKIELTSEQMTLFATLASKRWNSADVRTGYDVFNVLDLAKDALGDRVPEILEMRIDGLGLDGDHFRLHVEVDLDLWLATRMLHVEDFDQNNGKPTDVAVTYILNTLIYFRNGLVARAKEVV